jgi:hypothetical protein
MTAQLLRSRKPEEDHATTPWLASPGIRAEGSYSISRNDIDFFNVARERVVIQIKVTNASERPSPPGAAVVMAAPLGAFVPWQPLAPLPLPALAPGQVHHLRTEATALRPAPLGSPARVPPRKLLTALGLADNAPGDPPPRGTAQQAPGFRGLPADLMEMLLQETPHWVGNINVLVGSQAVERHLAKALRVYPGRVNMAWFFVGSGGRDCYAFRLNGLGMDWDARLFDMTARQSLVLDVGTNPGIIPGQWIPTDGTRFLLLALKVPHDCQAGTVEVQVCQQSTGRTAVVEFSLDPEAAGRGCYVV